MTSVKNIRGTGAEFPPNGYSSWVDYWEKNTRRKAYKCSQYYCSSQTDLVGAHVQKINSLTNTKYIVPLCAGCNAINPVEAFDVLEELVAID